MEILTIPPAHYANYRMDVMFDGYKWDLQAGEQSTISDKVLLLEPGEAAFLAQSARDLYQETVAMEMALQKNPALALETGISETMTEALCAAPYNPREHIRFMRFDFHPTTEGWRISEVNSDVPAGYPEASVLPALAQVYFSGCRPYGSFGDVFKNRLGKLVPAGSTIAYVHDTHTVEDYQILHYLGDLMEAEGYRSLYTAPEHIQWENGAAIGLGAVIRYFPVEWLEFSGAHWQPFVNAKTPACNHPVALLTQSKRLPVVWDRLGVPVPTWEALLPETVCASAASGDGWILKPAFGRVGEGINIPGTLSAEEDEAIRAAAKANPSQWVAQKMFTSAPVDGMHVSVGAFAMDGEFAGFFARISSAPRMDADASEIPILVRGDS